MFAKCNYDVTLIMYPLTTIGPGRDILNDTSTRLKQLFYLETVASGSKNNIKEAPEGGMLRMHHGESITEDEAS